MYILIIFNPIELVFRTEWLHIFFLCTPLQLRYHCSPPSPTSSLEVKGQLASVRAHVHTRIVHFIVQHMFSRERKRERECSHVRAGVSVYDFCQHAYVGIACSACSVSGLVSVGHRMSTQNHLSTIYVRTHALRN